jgi:hypothetical protein
MKSEVLVFVSIDDLKLKPAKAYSLDQFSLRIYIPNDLRRLAQQISVHSGI